MFHTTIMGPFAEVNEFKSSIQVIQEVKSPNEVISEFEKCSVELANLLRSCYCEPPCSVCRNVQPCEISSAQFGINNEDMQNHQVEIRNLSVCIRNELKSDSETLRYITSSTTISSLKEMLHSDSDSGFSGRAVALSFNDTILDESRTLADYSIQNHDVINLYECSEYSKISIGVPTYAKMEQVLFMPEDTVADVRSKVKMKNPALKDTARMRETYPIGLRGAVKNATGTTSCLYLDLFSEEMKIIIHERKGDCNFYYSSILGCEYTVDNILKLINREESIQERLLYLSNATFPRSYSVDHSWMQTFAPQIEAQPHSSNMPILLFFFPLCTKIVHFRVPKKTMLTIPQFISLFCEKALGMKGVTQCLYHPQTDAFLHKRKFLFHYRDMLAHASEPYSVILTKPSKRHQKSKTPWQHVGCVGIQWPTGKISLNVNLFATVNCLRERIEEHLTVPFSMQKLIFKGNPMPGNCTLNEIGIVEGSKIELHPILDFE